MKLKRMLFVFIFILLVTRIANTDTWLPWYPNSPFQIPQKKPWHGRGVPNWHPLEGNRVKKTDLVWLSTIINLKPIWSKEIDPKDHSEIQAGAVANNRVMWDATTSKLIKTKSFWSEINFLLVAALMGVAGSVLKWKLFH